MSQFTVQHAIERTGYAAEAGQSARFVIKPAKADQGVVFVFPHATAFTRDASPKRFIETLAPYASPDEILAFLGALVRNGLTNAVVEFPDGRMPVFKDPKRALAVCLDEAELEYQGGSEEFLQTKPVSVRSGQNEIRVLPADASAVFCDASRSAEAANDFSAAERMKTLLHGALALLGLPLVGRVEAVDADAALCLDLAETLAENRDIYLAERAEESHTESHSSWALADLGRRLWAGIAGPSLTHS